jgi:hypothetical protein
MDECIHPHTELETLRARMVYTGMDNMVILSPLPNKDMQTKVRIDRNWLDSIFFSPPEKQHDAFHLTHFEKTSPIFRYPILGWMFTRLAFTRALTGSHLLYSFTI